ncbi:MAG: tyrosine-protein phosphatase [Gemmataceae bacterium]
MTRLGTWVGVGCVLAGMFGLPWGYNTYRQKHFRNFRTVEPAILYRSGQMTLAGFEKAVVANGIRTVITLRDADVEGERPPDADEEALCRKLDVRHVRLRPQNWWTESAGSAPADANVQRFLAVMDNPANYPVLVHCFAGIHRTGAYVSIYRMEYEHWSNAKALQELRACGYRHLDDEWDVLGYLESYRPRWSREGGTEAQERR